ncbi:FAD-binding domain-containing protein [Burkholderiaceae bacterium FT117]|uniref:FAD-binding domain-containing protein n=1 Tax=Zeimonas sediminis TaxID=2944268 RepID=UPI002342E1C7|nr:FAD-binding domain-containing protein [Zeimonas sediminis]MCM5571386.1 FAD-binding domain-containing protein [Zeimonas sediminis]
MAGSTPGAYRASHGSAADRGDGFAPTIAAALARLDAADPAAYARTRNALDGAVLRVSPWVTHGFVDVPDAIERIAARSTLRDDDRLVFEFAWREFFHHVWRHLGDAILDDLGRPAWPGPRDARVPGDVLAAATGVPAIDQAVRALYRDGWLHNHARMWLASYLVHLRKLHWRAGADWMYGLLLDGDLASNHLSWQWVAGTFSSKPYLFDAANVERWAPQAWHSRGTSIDRGYDALERIARDGGDVGPEAAAARPAPAAPVPLRERPAPELLEGWRPADPAALRAAGVETVRLVHPWDLGEEEGPGARAEAPATPVAWLHPGFHRAFPWSDARWRFVLARLRQKCPMLHQGDASAWRAAGIALHGRETRNPGYREATAGFAKLSPVPRRFEDPAELCRSFSRFWKRVGPAGGERGQGSRAGEPPRMKARRAAGDRSAGDRG